jgi:hypothetical protein
VSGRCRGWGGLGRGDLGGCERGHEGGGEKAGQAHPD